MVDTKEMPFMEHLAELRTRLLHAAIGIFIVSLLALNWSSDLFMVLTSPVRSYFVSGQLIGTGPAEAFMTKLKVGLFAGFLLSAPNTFYQLWLFISPGLHDHEKKLAAPFVIVSSICFFLGVLFCFTVVLPFAFGFFSGEFASIGVSPQIRVDEYLSFVLRLVIVFGLTFEAPVIVYALARTGMVTSQFLRKNLRIAIVAIFVIAGILTPPDVVTQLLLAGPLLVLYAICIGVAQHVEKSTGSAGLQTGS